VVTLLRGALAAKFATLEKSIFNIRS